MDDDEIKQETDGTWTVCIDYGDVKPIKGIPSKSLAKEIVDAMWEMEREGCRQGMYED